MRVLILLVCGALIGCGGLYGAERANGAKVFCDRAGFEAGTLEHRECMLRYVEALMNRAGVRGEPSTIKAPNGTLEGLLLARSGPSDGLRFTSAMPPKADI